MRRLNGWDAVLLYSETPNVHKHTLKIGVIDSTNFDGDFTFEYFRQDLPAPPLVGTPAVQADRDSAEDASPHVVADA